MGKRPPPNGRRQTAAAGAIEIIDRLSAKGGRFLVQLREAGRVGRRLR